MGGWKVGESRSKGGHGVKGAAPAVPSTSVLDRETRRLARSFFQETSTSASKRIPARAKYEC